MRIVFAAWLVLASFPLGDSDLQPACRDRCDEVYAAELNACSSERFGADECRGAAEDRHQDCIDNCND